MTIRRIRPASPSPQLQGREQVKRIREAIKTITEAMNMVLTRDADARLRREYDDMTRWLEECISRLVELADAWERDAQAAGDDNEAQVDVNSEYASKSIAVQEAIQNESRQFQTISNALKARHDMAMQAIRNMR